MVYLHRSTEPGNHKAGQIGSSEQQVLLQSCVKLGVQGVSLACAFLCPLHSEAFSVWVLLQ